MNSMTWQDPEWLTHRTNYQSSTVSKRPGYKVGPRSREFFRQVEAKVITNSRNKIHQNLEPPFSRALYDQWCGDKWPFLQRAINCVWLLPSRMAHKTCPFIAAARVQTLYHAFYRHLLGITPLSDPMPLCTKQLVKEDNLAWGAAID